MTTYMTCSETAKLVRAELKKNFPGVTFSVRSKTYSGGASIDIHYVDGPTTKQVKHVAYRFEGAEFDGMIDLKTSKVTEMADGSKVQYGADFIFVHRDYTLGFMQSIAAEVSQKHHVSPQPEVKVGSGGAYVVDYRQAWQGSPWNIGEIIMQTASVTPDLAFMEDEAA